MLAPAPIPKHLEIKEGLCTYRPRGRHSLVEAVELVAKALATCRDRGVTHMMIDGTGFVDLPVPTLVDRFLMVEDWAQAAQSTVVAALVVPAKYIHPRKFGVNVAASFGLVCDIYTSEAAAMKWLLDTPVPGDSDSD